MIRRLVSVALAAAALAGAAAVAVPQHAGSLAVLAAATVAVVAAVFLLALVVPLASVHPEPWPATGAPSPAPPPLDPHGLRDARRDLAGRRAGTLPPAVRHRLVGAAELRRAATLAGDRDGVGATGPTDREPDPRAAAEVVHRVLDDLDRLRPGGCP